MTARRHDPISRLAWQLIRQDIEKAFVAKHGYRPAGPAVTSAAGDLWSLKGDEYLARARRELGEPALFDGVANV